MQIFITLFCRLTTLSEPWRPWMLYLSAASNNSLFNLISSRNLKMSLIYKTYYLSILALSFCLYGTEMYFSLVYHGCSSFIYWPNPSLFYDLKWSLIYKLDNMSSYDLFCMKMMDNKTRQMALGALLSILYSNLIAWILQDDFQE